MRRSAWRTGVLVLAFFAALAAGTARSAEQDHPRASCAGKVATAVGTPKNDVIRLGTKRFHGHVVATGGGNDRIVGSKRRDLICPGQGNDVVRAGGGPDRVLASGGSDVVMGGGGRDSLGGRGGHDRILGGEGDDFIGGGGRSDRLSGGGGADRILGAKGADRIKGGRGADAITGGADDDRLSGGRRSDFLEGAAGNDVLNGGGGDRLIASTGRDIVRGGAGVDSATLGPGRDTASGGAGPDDIDAGPGLDEVAGDEGDDRLHGEAGPDRIDGGAGNDAIYGELVDDRLVGGSGDDLLSGGHGSDDLIGGSGDDILRGDFGQDFNWGDAGNDTVSYATATPPGPSAAVSGVFVDLPDERATEEPPHKVVGRQDQRELVTGIENVVGSNFDDEAIGAGGGSVRGLGGTETCIGFGSDDCAFEPPAVTTTVVLDGGADPGLLVKAPPGPQPDRITISITATGYLVSTGAPVIPGPGCSAAGPTSVACPNPSRPLGYVAAWTGEGNDEITIGEGFPGTIVIELDGGGGNDILRGGESSELLLAGSSGGDYLFGNGGDDALITGPGGDVLNGGVGNDQMVATTPCDGHSMSGGPGAGDIAGFALSYDQAVDATIGGTAVGRGAGNCSPTHIGADNEVLEGTQHADILRGNRRPNFLILGRNGDDQIFGRGGRDVLRGDEGSDSLYGGGGRDVLQAHDSEKDAVLHCGRGGRRAVRDRIDPVPKRCGKHHRKRRHRKKR